MTNPANVKVDDRFHDVLVFLEQAAQTEGVCLPPESESLFDQGVLDSFGLLEFIAFLEQTFHITIPDDDLTPGRFESIEKIRQYVQSRVAH